MTTLTHAFPTVKGSRPAGRIFGLGAFPNVAAVPSFAERAEIVSELEKADAIDAMHDAELDRMAEEAAWQSSYEAGYAHS